MTKIRVNYANVDRQVGRLLNISREHSQAAEALEAQKVLLSSAWRDPAGSTYVQAAAALASEMRDTAREIEALAHRIKDAATRYRQQEEAGAQAARRLQS